jgi:hypothetical protein
MNSGFNNFPAAALPTKWRGGGPTLGTYSPAAGALFVMPSDSGTLFEVNLIPAGAVLSGKAFLPSYTQVAPGFSVWFKVANAPQATASTYVDFTINFYGAEQPKNVGYVNLDISGNPFPIKLCRDGEVVGLMATPTGWDVIGYFGAAYQDNSAHNPKGVIAQRVIGTAVTNTSSYGACDRWKIGVTGTVTAGTYVQDTADGISQSNAIKVLGLSTSSATPIIYFHQYLESKDVSKFKNRVCSCGVWVKHTAAVNCNVTLKVLIALGGTDNFGSTTGATPASAGSGFGSAAVSVPANTWTFIAIPSMSWISTDPSAGMVIEVGFAVSAGTLTTKDFKITDVTLQPGPFVVPVVELRQGAEQLQCQRYYEVWNDDAVNSAIIGTAQNFAGGSIGARVAFFYQVRKRIIPSITVSAAGDIAIIDAGNANVYAITTVTPSNINSLCAMLDLSGTGATMTSGAAARVIANNANARIRIEADF